MSALPSALAEIVDDFAAVGASDKLTLLLEFSRELPPLPAELEQSAMEPVPRMSVAALPLGRRFGSRQRPSVLQRSPPEAPTTRGFASILAQGLDGHSADEILGVPDDFYSALGLAEAVSPLRLRGMSAMLARIKRHLRG